MKYFSVKKIWLVLLVLFVSASGIFVILNLKDSGNALLFERNTNDEAEKAFNAIVLKDSDGDGLKDWEEALWKTNPNNPDSDNDGTSDGEEVRLDRNPTKPAPGDSIKIVVENTKWGISTYTKPTTITGALTEDFFSKYFALKEKGSLDEQSKTELITSVVQNITSIEDSKPKVRELNELKIESGEQNNSKEALREYGNTLAKIFINYATNYSENEIEILDEAFTSKNELVLEKLSTAITDYKRMIEELIDVKTPKSMSLTHLKIVNTYEEIVTSLENAKTLFTDPIRGLMGMSTYIQQTQQINTIGEDLSNIFFQKKVIFGENDFGAVFFLPKN